MWDDTGTLHTGCTWNKESPVYVMHGGGAEEEGFPDLRDAQGRRSPCTYVTLGMTWVPGPT